MRVISAEKFRQAAKVNSVTATQALLSPHTQHPHHPPHEWCPQRTVGFIKAAIVIQPNTTPEYPTANELWYLQSTQGLVR